MRWLELGRVWRLVAACSVVGLVAACGGSGGSGGTEPNSEVTPIAGQYALVIVGGATVPTTVQPENCAPVRFRAGGMALEADGTWRMVLQIFNADGTEYDVRDEGRFQRADDELSFQSDVFGDRFSGSIEAPLVHFYHDWCPDGRGDVDLTFSR